MVYDRKVIGKCRILKFDIRSAFLGPSEWLVDHLIRQIHFTTFSLFKINYWVSDLTDLFIFSFVLILLYHFRLPFVYLFETTVTIHLVWVHPHSKVLSELSLPPWTVLGKSYQPLNSDRDFGTVNRSHRGTKSQWKTSVGHVWGGELIHPLNTKSE